MSRCIIDDAKASIFRSLLKSSVKSWCAYFHIHRPFQFHEFVEHVLDLIMGEIVAAGRKATFNQSINQSIFVEF